MEESRFALKRSARYDIPEGENIWKEGIPDFEPERDNEDHIEDRGGEIYDRFFVNICKPMFYAFPAPANNNTGKAVVICPGGAYHGVAIDKEGFDVARLFNSIGISAFVLKYRMPNPDGRNGLLQTAPLNDACRSIRLVRSRAAKYGIDPDKVGIMGFSSGGHLASSASTLYATVRDNNQELDALPARPSFSILIYAVISLVEDYCHSGSRLALLGENPSEALMAKYSAERNVTPDTPPVFLAQTEDDGVSVLNALAYYRAAKLAGVPAEMHLFPCGGHGYGMKIRGLAVDSWPLRMMEWIQRL